MADGAMLLMNMCRTGSCASSEPVYVAAAADAAMGWGTGLAYLLALLCFFPALRNLCRGGASWHVLSPVTAGTVLAIGTTLYIHDATSLPQIGIALLLGGGIGLTIGQHVAQGRSVAALSGLSGLAAVMATIAVYLDPDASGLGYAVVRAACVAAVDCGLLNRIQPDGAFALVLGGALGAMILSGSATILLRGRARGEGRPVSFRWYRVSAVMGVLASLSLVGAFAGGFQPPSLLAAILFVAILTGVLIVLSFAPDEWPRAMLLLLRGFGLGTAAIGLVLHVPILAAAAALVVISHALSGHLWRMAGVQGATGGKKRGG